MLSVRKNLGVAREFNEALSDINWDEILLINENDPNVAINNFHRHINYLLYELAPYKKLSKKELKLKSKPWINNLILIEIHKHDKLLHKYSKMKNKDSDTVSIIFVEYKKIRNIVTKLKRDSKLEYYHKFFEENKKKSSAIWKGIRSIVNINNTLRKDINLLNDKGKNVSDPTKIAKLLNKYFASVGPNIDNKIPKSLKNFKEYMKKINVNKTFSLNVTTPQEIFDIILAFGLKKSLGPNSIPMYVLKVANLFFADKLCDIINLSFINGIFPDLCKLAKVIPLFKKDNPLLRPIIITISLLPVYSKIIEKLIYTRTYHFLDSNNLFYERQFGFISKYSTNHALISTTEWIKSYIDKGNFVGGIFIDLQKAFDTVNHDILCEKLMLYGFRGNSYLLIKSFLTNRKQFVSINGFNSSHIEITCGVPQGSTLEPLLFLLYINYLNLSFNNAIASHFADDTCIMYGSSKPKTLETVLNCDLKKISDWLKANRLSLNVKKSKLIFFQKKQSNFDRYSISIKLDGCKLVPSGNVQYLGVHIDNFVSWDFHITLLSNKLIRANGIISKLRHFTTKETLLSVYYAIFYSHMAYGCLVWSLTTTKNIDSITILQKKCLHILNFAPINSHTNYLFFFR